jgi:phosphoribosylaminoimidazole-succinocarboxamide synthase
MTVRSGLMELIHSGKVRDVYADGDDLILVASDRVSVYDVVLPTPIPDKGRILTQLSLWWFDQLGAITPNHVISATDVPAQWAGRAIRCRRLEMIPVECIARGYLSGLGLVEYQDHRSVSGVRLPDGLFEASRLPTPIFTPTTKEAPGSGKHDEFITLDDVTEQLGAELAAHLRDTTLRIYEAGAALAATRGIIIADTKLEFGRAPDGTIVLADELLTPDSSRFWPAHDWQAGRPQHAMDKQFLRDWAAGTGWDKSSRAPDLPEHIVAATRDRYIGVFEQLTGERWS